MNKFGLIFFLILFTILQPCTIVIIAAEKQFNATAVAYPPFTLNKTTEHGMSWELSKTALETQGYTVSVEFAPWARAFSDTKDGKYDGLLIAYWTKERAELFVYHDHPVAFVSTGLFKKKERKDIKYTGNLSDISSFDIGVERNASMGEEFDKADYLNKIFVNDSKQILKMVYLGNIDLGVAGFEYSMSNLKNIAKLPGFEGIVKGIEFIQPPFARRPAYLMISQKAPDFKQKLKDLNAGLEKIRTNGVFKSILKKYGISVAEYFPE
jgi:polar amino acid transport system substrate-binding protein